MGTNFFIGWELWEQMTFVLACCIVLVLAFGLIKLWRITQLTQRLEMEDAEKRARQFDVQHCGIDHYRKMDDIPFGVRAIQRGVEVEGIWICHADSPDASQVASSATLIGDQTDVSKSRSAIIDTQVSQAKSKHAFSETGRLGSERCPRTLAGNNSPGQSCGELRDQPATRLCIKHGGSEMFQSLPYTTKVCSYVPRGALDMASAVYNEPLVTQNDKAREREHVTKNLNRAKNTNRREA